MLGLGGERHGARAATQRAAGIQRDAVERPGGRDRHRPGRRLKLRARKQPARQQRLRQRHGRRIAAGDAENGEAVGEARARAAQFLRNPGERQARVFERPPQRFLPGVVFGPIDRLGIGEVRKNPRRRFGDDMVAFARHVLLLFVRFPPLKRRLPAARSILPAMVGPSRGLGKQPNYTCGPQVRRS
jgi:hypothetical protein